MIKRKPKSNPHKSHARISAKRSAATTAVFQKAASCYAQARKLERSDPTKAAALYRKASELLTRANKSGGIEGPVGRLPNGLFDPIKKAVRRRRGSRALKAEQARQRAWAGSIQGWTGNPEKKTRRQLMDEQPIIRRPREHETPQFGSLSMLMPKGAKLTKVRLSSGQVVSRVERLNPGSVNYSVINHTDDGETFEVGLFDTKEEAERMRRKQNDQWRYSKGSPRVVKTTIVIDKTGRRPQSYWPRRRNFGLIDLATNLQAADYVNKALGSGRKKKNPSHLDWSAITRFNFTYALPGGAWIEDAKGDRDWVSFAVIQRRLGKEWLERALRKQGQFTGTWVTIAQKKNPSVADLSKTFQGKASGAVIEFKAANSAPSNLARIGALVFLKLADSSKQTRVPGATVAVDQKGKIWIVSNRTPLFSRKARPGEVLDFGEIDKICYLTAKKHIENGRMTEYVHSFGEEGGKRPRLLIDSEGMPIMRGGDYRIKSEGIVD